MSNGTQMKTWYTTPSNKLLFKTSINNLCYILYASNSQLHDLKTMVSDDFITLSQGWKVTYIHTYYTIIHAIQFYDIMIMVSGRRTIIH